MMPTGGAPSSTTDYLYNLSGNIFAEFGPGCRSGGWQCYNSCVAFPLLICFTQQLGCPLTASCFLPHRSTCLLFGHPCLVHLSSPYLLPPNHTTPNSPKVMNV